MPAITSKILRLLFILLVALCALPSKASVSEMSVNELFERGRVCTTMPERGDSALIYYTEVINRYADDPSQNGKQYLARAYNNRGYVWQYMKLDYEKAVQDLLKSLDISESFPESIPTEAFTCLNLGNLFDSYSLNSSRSNRYRERAVKYWTRSVDVAKRLKEWEIMMRAYCPLSLTSLQTSVDTHHYSSLRNLSRLMLRSGVPEGIMLKSYCMMRARALEAVADRDFEKAVTLFRKELPLIDTHLTPERYIIDTYGCLVLCFNIMERQDSVNKYIRKIDEIIKGYGLKDLNSMVTLAKLSLGEKKVNPEPADSLKNILDKQTEEILRNHKLESISEIYLESEMEKSQLREVELEKSQAKNSQIILVVSIALLIVIGISGLLVYKIRSLRRRNRQLYELAHNASLPNPREFIKTESVKEESIPKYSGSKLTDESLREILRKAIHILDSTEQIYSPDFTISLLVELAETKPRYLSQAISEIDGRNFNALVNERRVREACRRFDDITEYGTMSVEAIGQSVGFKSRSTFTTAFRQVTDMTPAAYARIARSRNKQEETS